MATKLSLVENGKGSKGLCQIFTKMATGSNGLCQIFTKMATGSWIAPNFSPYFYPHFSK
jgi:hypothetical protein